MLWGHIKTIFQGLVCIEHIVWSRDCAVCIYIANVVGHQGLGMKFVLYVFLAVIFHLHFFQGPKKVWLYSKVYLRTKKGRELGSLSLASFTAGKQN